MASSVANANLVSNGSFENNNVNAGTWSWFSSSSVDGWSGSNIELWNDFGGMIAQDGTKLAELNAHGGSGGGAFSIFQEITTTAGELYDFSFYYAARQNTNESFLVEVFSSSGSLISQLVDDHIVKQWSSFTSSFVAADSATTVRFTTVTPLSGTLGNFIDNVIVTESTTSVVQASAPSAALLTLFGLAMLLVRRSK